MRTIEERLDSIQSLLEDIFKRQKEQEWYSTEQFAQIVGKAEYTVREWARHNRILAKKMRSGRGKHCSWAISHSELLRYQREGLLPASYMN